ncbi:MAG: NADH-quinone oxidoreductase subunit C [Elusimicrobia bacterium]|nr:NADH-quinone oxidoreductase subunit C [Elusimicrobiota bacterium]
MISCEEVFKSLKESIGDDALSLEGTGFDSVILLRQTSVHPALEKLKGSGFNVLIDLTAVDYSQYGQGAQRHGLPVEVPNPAPRRGCRFKLTYRLMSLDAGTGLVEGRVALQCWVEGEQGPLSVQDLWPNADWLEREVWDMFGVRFADRPEIKRLLLYEQFEGHPLRKDYPINKRQPLIGPKDDHSRDRMTEGDLRPRLVPRDKES